jgi:DNA primase
MYDKKGALRYMKAKNVPQDDVLFMTEWPRAGTKIYIMEGEFDALSLRQAGLVACALGGKSISDTQIEMIRQYEPVLAFDADEGEFKEDTGLQALINVGMTLLERGFHKVSYVRPPKVYKDWNKLLVERNAPTIKAYVERFEKPFTTSTPDLLLAAKL